MSVLIVTGTDTGVGKTVATAALAAATRHAGYDVAVCKPIQTGTAVGDDDLQEVHRLAGVDKLVGSWRFPEPVAPLAAASHTQLALPTRVELDVFVRAVDRARQLTLVEGAGGLLVQLGSDGTTLRDLAVDLHAGVLLVVSARLGTLNHTALTLEALAAHDVDCAGLVVGAWPHDPGFAEESNLEALALMAPLRAVLPEGSAALAPDDFQARSAAAFESEWVAGLVS